MYLSLCHSVLDTESSRVLSAGFRVKHGMTKNDYGAEI